MVHGVRRHHFHQNYYDISNRVHLEMDEGFNLQFETVLEEFEDELIYFDKPLRSWLQGDVVS